MPGGKVLPHCMHHDDADEKRAAWRGAAGDRAAESSGKRQADRRLGQVVEERVSVVDLVVLVGSVVDFDHQAARPLDRTKTAEFHLRQAAEDL